MQWDLVANERDAVRGFDNLADAAERSGKRIDDAFDDANVSTGKFRQGLSDAIATAAGGAASAGRLFANPWVVAIGAVTGAALAVPAGAAVAGAALTGLGMGMVGLGAYAVRGKKSVLDALDSLQSEAGAAVERAGASMEKPFVDSINVMRGTVRDLEPALTDMFEDVAPHVTGVAYAVDSMANRSMPGLERAVSASGGVLDKFSGKLPETGDAVSDFFDSISEGAEGGGDALLVFMDMTNQMLRTTGNVIEGLSKSYDFFANGPGRFVSGLLPLVNTNAKVAASNKEVSSSTELMAMDFERAVREAGGLAAAFDKLNGGALNYSDAQIAAQESLTVLRESFREHGKSLDVATEAGQRNQAALNDVARGARDVAQAKYDAVKATGDEAAALAAAESEYDAYILRLVKTMRQAGKTDAEIQTVIDTVGKMPTMKGVNITTTAPQAQAQIEALDGRVRRMKTSQNITVTTYMRTIGNPAPAGSMTPADPLRPGFGAPVGGPTRRAGGGPTQAGMMYLVGEAGPELLTMPASGQVTPTHRIAAASAPINLTVNVTAAHAHPAEVGRAAVEAIQEYERRNGTGWRN